MVHWGELGWGVRVVSWFNYFCLIGWNTQSELTDQEYGYIKRNEIPTDAVLVYCLFFLNIQVLANLLLILQYQPLPRCLVQLNPQVDIVENNGCLAVKPKAIKLTYAETKATVEVQNCLIMNGLDPTNDLDKTNDLNKVHIDIKKK